MVSTRSEFDNSQFSWRRTSSIAFAVALHALAFLIVLAPIMPPEAKAFVPDEVTVIDIVERPPPEEVLPVPKMPLPPKPEFVEKVNPPEPVPPVAVVVEEASPMAKPAVVVPEAPVPRSVPVNVVPSADLAYRQHHKPAYPAQAVRMRHEGEVVLLVLVGVDGSVQEIDLEQSSGYPELDRAAVRAARDWKFRPGTRGGVPYQGWARVPIAFNLDRY